MSDAVQRRPALGRVDPIEAAIPQRPAPAGSNHGGAAPAAVPDGPSSEAPVAAGETLNTPLNTRIRASTRARLELAVNKLRYERSDRSISLASVTDRALDAFLTETGV